MANLPEYGSGVAADSFTVRPVRVESSEAENLYRAAQQSQAMADRIGAEAVRQSEQWGADVGAATVVYEQQPDGTTRLRPLDQLLSWNVGAGNRAYNAAVMRNYGAAVETEARATFGRLQTQYANDTQGFATAARAYIDTTTESMPERVRGTVNTQLNVLATGFSTALHERVNRVARDQTFSTALNGAADLHRDIANLARAGDPARAGEGLVRLERRLQDIRTEHPDRLNDVQIATLMREARVDVTASTLANEALRAYSSGGIVASQALVTRWTEQGYMAVHPTTGRQIVRNADGTVSTELGITVTVPELNNGRPTNIPSMWDGRRVNQREAVRRAVASGQRFDSYDTVEQATAASIAHSQQLGQVPMQHTPEERAIIAQRALGPVRDREQNRQTGRALADQAAQDELTRLRGAYARALQSPEIQTEADRALAAQRVQSLTTNPRARDEFIIGITNPAMMAERAAARQAEAQAERTAERVATQAERAITQANAALIEDTRMRLREVPVGDVEGQRRIIGEAAAQAGTRAWEDRGAMTAEQARARPPQPAYDQASANHVYNALSGPSDAVAAARVRTEEAAIGQLTVLDMEQRIDAAAAGQQPTPYPFTEMMRTLPPEQWPAAAHAINERHKHELEQIRQLTEAQRNVNARTSEQMPPANQANVDTVFNNAQVDPANPRVRGAPNLADHTTVEGRAAIDSAANLAIRSGQIPTRYMQQIDVGLAPTADFRSVENANYLWSRLMADPVARPRMEQLLGERVTRLQDNADQIRTIRSNPANEIRGEPDAGKMEEDWQRVQTRRSTAARTPAAQVEQDNAIILRTTNVVGAQLGYLEAGLRGMQSPELDPNRAAWAAVNPALAFVLSPFIDLRRTPGTVGTGSTSFLDFMLFGDRGVAIGASPGEIPVGMSRAYMDRWNQNVALGMRDPAQLHADAFEVANRRYRPSVLSTSLRDRAVMVDGGPEAVGRALYNYDPPEVAAQLAQTYDAHVAAARAANQPLELRTLSGIEAVRNGDVYVIRVHGTDSDPRWHIMARRADGPGGTPGEHVALFKISGVNVPGLEYDLRDQATFRILPNPSGPAERAREEALNSRATRWVNDNLPNLPTGMHSAVVGLTRMQMRFGIEPYSPIEGARRVESRPPQSAILGPAAAAAAPAVPAPGAPSAPPVEDPITGFRPRQPRQ